LALLALVVVGVPVGVRMLMQAPAHQAGGQYLCVAVAIVTGAIGGRVTDLTMRSYLASRHAKDELPSDQMLVCLLVDTSYMYRIRLDTLPPPPALVRVLRSALNDSADRIAANPVPLRATGRMEREPRARIRRDHARVGAAIRAHSTALASLRSAAEFERMRQSLRTGLLLVARGDWNELLTDSPEITAVSRIRSIARRTVPSAVVAAFGVAIPLLPGVGAAGGSIRVLLLATAVLMLMPGGDTAGPVVREGLSRALGPGRNSTGG
jgi:hypothetical protein